MPMRVTVAICTYNRYELLQQTISSLLAQSQTFPILIVDNASTDATKEIVHKIQASAPQIRYVYEPRLGIASARNRVIDEVDTPFVIYIDDDVILEPRWLETILHAFDTLDPVADAIGGRVCLDYATGEQPAWLDDRLRSFLAYLNHGDEICEAKNLYGLNLAFRSAVLKKYRFKLHLGYTGRDSMIASDETDLLSRMIKDGCHVYYVPQAIVRHQIGPERLTKDYFIRRARGEGTSRARIFLDKTRPSNRLTILKMMVQQARYERLWIQTALKDLITGQILRNARERFYWRVKFAQFCSSELFLLRTMFQGNFRSSDF